MDNLISLFGEVYWETDASGRFCRIEALSSASPACAVAAPALLGHAPWGCSALVAPASTWQAWHDAMQQRAPLVQLMLEWKISALGLRRMSVSAQPRLDAQGTFSGHRGVMQDVTDQKNEEDMLRRFRVALEASGDSILLVDRDSMRVIDVNDTACHASGYTREELLRMAPYDLLTADREAVDRDFDEVIAADNGRGVVTEGEVRDRQGRYSTFELCRRAIRFDGRWIVATIARDITRRRQAEDTARRMSKMYATISGTNEAILHATTLHDMFQQVCEVAVREGQIMNASVMLPDPDTGMAKMVAVAGLGADTLRSTRISFRDDIPEGHGMVGTAFRTQQPCVINDYLNDERVQIWRDQAREERAAAGAALPLVRDGQSIGVLLLYSRDKDGFDEDILALLGRMAQNIVFAISNLEHERDRRAAEDALRASEEKYRTILDGIEEAYYEVDLQGTMVMYNGAFARMFGYSPTELIGMNYQQAHLPADSRFVFANFNEVYKTGVPKKGLDWRMVHKSGQLMLCEGSIHLIRDCSGTPTGFRGMLRDVTARRTMEAALRESEERFRDLTALSSHWYWEQDACYRFVQINGDVEGKTGIPAQTYLGKALWELDFDTLTVDQWVEHRSRLEQGEPFDELVLKSRTAQGQVRYLSISGLPKFDQDGRLTGYRGTGKDITGKKLAEERIRHLASHDMLTGLPNRMMFHQVLNFQIQQARRYDRQFALMFIDLDHFKEINDTLGHDAGDMLLKETATRLTGIMRASDFAARLAGDEFVVIVPEMEGTSQVAALAQKIVHAMRAPVMLAGAPRSVTASIGICLFPDHGTDEESLLKHADAAMYRVKHSSKNDFQFFLHAV